MNKQPLTFKQFQESERDRIKRVCPDVSQDEINEIATPHRWHNEHLAPFVLSGGIFGAHVIHSIHKHGHYSLAHFAKHFPESLPPNTDIINGRMIP